MKKLYKIITMRPEIYNKSLINFDYADILALGFTIDGDSIKCLSDDFDHINSMAIKLKKLYNAYKVYDLILIDEYSYTGTK